MRTAGFLLAAFSVIPAVFGAPLEAEHGIVKRAAADTIAAQITKVDNGVKSLDAAVKKVTSADLTVLLAVNTEAQNLGETIKQAQAVVEPLPEVDLFGAIGIELPTLSLVGDVDTLSKDLIAIKKYTDEAGVSAVVLQQVQSQKTVSEAFGKVLVSKVPEAVRFIGELHAKQISDSLQKVIDAYSQ